MSSTKRTTRRQFLQRSGVAVAAPYVIAATALGNDKRPPASERIVMGGIGIGVMGGMIAATAIGIFFIPLLFVAVRRLFKGKSRGAATQPDADPAAGTA